MSNIIIEGNLDIIIHDEDIPDSSKTITIEEQLEKFRSTTDFTNHIIFTNIREIKEQLETNSEDTESIFEHNKQEIAKILKSNKLFVDSINQKYEKLLITEQLEKNNVHSELIESKSIIGLHVDKVNKLVEDFKNIYDNLELIGRSLNQSFTDQNKRLENNEHTTNELLVDSIPRINKKIAQNELKTRAKLKLEIDSILSKLHESENIFLDRIDSVESDIKTIKNNIDLKLSKTELDEFTKFLDLHISEILNETQTNKTSIELLESNLDNINKLLIEKIESSGNVININATKTIKQLLENNITQLKNKLADHDERFSKLQNNQVKISDDIKYEKKQLIESVTTKISEQYQYKLNQLKETFDLKLKRFDQMIESVKSKIKDTKNVDVDFVLDKDIIKQIIDEYFIENEVSFNNTPEHKYDGVFLYFKQPNGEWGHGIRVNHGQNNGGFAYWMGGEGQLKIYDEGILINDKTTEINFIGSDVMSVNRDNGRVDVYIPSPSYSSFFGSGSSTISYAITTQRNISNPNGQFDIGDWIAGTKHDTLPSGTLIYETSDVYSYESNISSTVGCQVLSWNNTVISQFILSELSGNSDQTQNHIRIINTDYAPEALRYKIKTRFEIDISEILPNGGRFTIRLFQNNNTIGNFSFLDSDIFYDSNNNLAELSGVSISENVPIVKQLSGVSYYNLGSTFNVLINDIDNINDKSYPDKQVKLSGSELGLSDIELSGADITNWNTDWNCNNVSFTKTNWGITQPNMFVASTTANINAKTLDWIDDLDVSSNNLSVIIDTWIDNTTRIFEDFRNESQRLKANLLTSWDSSEKLNNINNGLQIKNSQLIYPSEDFGIYQPNIITQPNYTSLTGIKTYYRRFWSAGNTYSNGILTFSGINLSENHFGSGNKLNIEWTIDKTNWFRMDLDYQGGVISPNGASRVNKDSINLNSVSKQIAFTMGECKFSAEIWFKIEISDSTIKLNSIALNW